MLYCIFKSSSTSKKSFLLSFCIIKINIVVIHIVYQYLYSIFVIFCNISIGVFFDPSNDMYIYGVSYMYILMLYQYHSENEYF